MVCNFCCRTRSFVLLILAFNLCDAQDPNFSSPNLTEILRMPEANQRKFVADYLNAPSAHVEGYPPTSDNSDDFTFLMNEKDWVLPMTEDKIKEWLKNPEDNRKLIDHVATTIVFAGTIEALEFVARVFANTPYARKWIEAGITSKFGWRDPNFITKFYYALESKNPLIREVAAEVIPLRLKDLDGANLHIWGAALIERYQGLPTTLQLLKDPLVEIGRVQSGIHPEELRKTLASYAKQAYERKQAGGEKKPR